MANLVYNKGLEELAKALTDLDNSDLRLLLVKDTYVANKDHLFIDDGSPDDPLSHEITVTGYARQALANKAVTRDDAGDFAYLDADDVVFAGLSGSSQTCHGAVLYRHTGVDTMAPLIAFFDLTDTAIGGSVTSFTVQWATPATGGVLKLASG